MTRLIAAALFRWTRWRLDRRDDPAIRDLSARAAEARKAHRRSRDFTDAMRARRIERLRQQFGRPA